MFWFVGNSSGPANEYNKITGFVKKFKEEYGY